MTAKEFNRMDTLHDKAILLWDIGEFIDDRVIYNQYRIKMYSVYNFYVEAWIKVKGISIEKIFALENEEGFEGYISSIKLEHLY